MRAVALAIIVVLASIVEIGVQVQYSHIGPRGRIRTIRDRATVEVATTWLVTIPKTLATEVVLDGAAIMAQIMGTLGVQLTATITQGITTVGVVTTEAAIQVEMAGQMVVGAMKMLATDKPGVQAAHQTHCKRCQAAGRALRHK